MKRFLMRAVLVIVALVGLAFYALFFSSRPPLTIDPATLAGDGSQIDYCVLPELDNSGKRAVDIPKGNTPGCSYSHFPLPILAQCTEPLVDEADDLRGLWKAYQGSHANHVERVEQCGSRTVITAAGIIHDYGPNSTLGMNTNDVEGQVVSFEFLGKQRCARTSASMIWTDGVLGFHIFGVGPVVVRRYREGEDLVWEYADGATTKMRRVCTLPESHRLR